RTEISGPNERGREETRRASNDDPEAHPHEKGNRRMIKRTSLGWQIRWRDTDGRQRKEVLKGATRAEAEQRQRELLTLRDRGERVVQRRDVPTFGALATLYQEERRAGWKLGTRVQYADVLKNHV